MAAAAFAARMDVLQRRVGVLGKKGGGIDRDAGGDVAGLEGHADLLGCVADHGEKGVAIGVELALAEGQATLVT